MADSGPPPPDVLQDLLDELPRFGERQIQIIVEIAALLRRDQDEPDVLQERLDKLQRIGERHHQTEVEIMAIIRRDYQRGKEFQDSLNNLVHSGDRVNFGPTPRANGGRGQVVVLGLGFPDHPYVKIERELGAGFVFRHTSNVNLVSRGTYQGPTRKRRRPYFPPS